jgi:hypothetical protein
MLDPFCRMSSNFLRYRQKIRDPGFNREMPATALTLNP